MSTAKQLMEAREVLSWALGEWDDHNGPWTDKSNPHWSNVARRLLDKQAEYIQESECDEKNRYFRGK